MSEYNKLQTYIIEKNIPEDSRKFSRITASAWHLWHPDLADNQVTDQYRVAGEWTADCEHSLSLINPIQELGHLGTPYIDPMWPGYVHVLPNGYSFPHANDND